MKKKIIMGVIFAAVLAGGLYFAPGFLKADKPADTKNVPPLGVFVTEVAMGRVYDSVDALGTAFSAESVEITSNVSELVREMNFTDGQVVRKGDVIAVLEQRELQADLEAARARLEQDRRELARLEGLLKDKAVPRQDYEMRQTTLEITRREVEAIEARIAYRTLRAPFDGVLGVRRISPGALVQPGDVITTLDDIRTIKLDFTVPSNFLPSLKKGGAVEAEADALDGRIFRGVIDSINTRVDPVTRSVLVRALLDNADGMLKPGLLLKVTLIKNERQSLVLPEESLLQRQIKHYAMVVGEDGTVEEREVTVGARLPGRVEVSKGLTAGEKVIVRGINRVQAGQKVEIGKLVDAVNDWSGEGQQ